MRSMFDDATIRRMREDKHAIASIVYKETFSENTPYLVSIRHYAKHHDINRALTIIEKTKEICENTVIEPLYQSLINSDQLKNDFIDIEPVDDKVVVYFEATLPESKLQSVSKFLSTYGEPSLLALPGDEIFENMFSNFYVFSLQPSTVQKESLSKLTEKIKKGILYKRARTSAKMTGGALSDIRKSMLRALGKKGFINHNVYYKGGDEEMIAKWEKFVGKKKRS